MIQYINYELPEGNLNPISWFDISNQVLDTFILKDQIEVPDKVFIDSFLFGHNLMTNLEMFMMYNIYHLNLLKIKDIQLPKKDFQYGQIFNIIIGIFNKMTKNYNSALKLVNYLASLIDLSVNEAGALFNSEYAHFVPPIIISEACKTKFYDFVIIQQHIFIHINLFLINLGFHYQMNFHISICSRRYIIKYKFKI